MQRDPNRYAEGLEASALRARLEGEELALDVLRTNYERAQRAHAETEVQFCVAEQQYLLHKGLLEDSSKYLGKAKSQYDSQAASVALERVLFHPIRKTPLDVLAYIFEHCLEDITGDEPISVESDNIRKRQQQPFHLAAVCRRWRQASLAHPRAWSHLEWSFDPVKPTNMALWLSYLATLLDRARSAPLTACLTRRRESQPYHDDLGRQIAGIMCRCLRLQITIWNLNSGDSLLPVMTAATPKLTRVYFRLASFKSDAVLRNTQILPNTPALKYICANKLFHGGPIAFPVLDTAHIYSLECTDEKDALAIILGSSPQLADLALYWPHVAYQRANQTRVVIPRIKSLILQVSDTCPVEQLSARFEFTSMTSLLLYGDPPSTKQRLRFLRALGEKSPLEELSISNIGNPSFASFLDVLPSLGNLKKLLVWCTELTNDNLLALRNALCPQDRSAKWPCPHLLGIRFNTGTCAFAEDCNSATLIGMIECRASAANDDALALENRPTALHWLLVSGWKSSDDESIQDKIDRAIEAAT